MPKSNCKLDNSTPIKFASFFLLAALTVYPFSIAATSIFFALLLVTSFVKPAIFSHGFYICWEKYRLISVGILSIIAFNFLGTLWGDFDDLAIHKMSKQINWLLIPVIIGLSCLHFNIRRQAFLAISIGLFLHLILCTLQYNQIIPLSGWGRASSADDATGLLGHLSFGFIYGIWAGMLIVAAQGLTTKWKLIFYMLATYAVITVFLAQGRSGYITTFACLTLVLFKVLYPNRWRLKIILLSLLIVCLTVFVSTQERVTTKILGTVSGVSSFLHGDWENVDIRIQIWAVYLEIWKENPYFGVGTAGYPQAAKTILEKPELDYLKINPENMSVFYVHPHNEFLLALVRWGPLGLFALLFLCWNWVRTGWQSDWQNDTMNAYLLTASGISVILHGLTEPSLNTHLETVFVIIILGFGMSKSSKLSEK